jgi:hypothetical protein
MALEVVSFDAGILTVRESGHVDAKDARAFATAVSRYATSSEMPIVVLIDAREMQVMMPAANKVFIRSSTIPNVLTNVVVTGNLVATHAAEVLSIRNYRQNTIVFDSWEEGLQHARQQAAVAREQGAIQ